MNSVYPDRFEDQEKLDQFVSSHPAVSISKETEYEICVWDVEDEDEAVYQYDEQSEDYQKMETRELDNRQVSQRKRFCPNGTGYKKQGRKLKTGKGKSDRVEPGVVSDSITALKNGADAKEIIESRSYRDVDSCIQRIRRFAESGSPSFFRLSDSLDILSEQFNMDRLEQAVDELKRHENQQNIDEAQRVCRELGSVWEHIEQVRQHQSEIQEQNQAIQTLIDEFIDRQASHDERVMKSVRSVAEDFDLETNEVETILLDEGIIEEHSPEPDKASDNQSEDVQESGQEFGSVGIESVEEGTQGQTKGSGANGPQNDAKSPQNGTRTFDRFKEEYAETLNESVKSTWAKAKEIAQDDDERDTYQVAELLAS